MRTLIFAFMFLSACTSTEAQTKTPMPPAAAAPDGLEVATLAGGCFWCMESVFDEIPGVVSAVSGYTDGQVVNPTYKAVGRGETGHTEAILVTFDPKKITYEKVVEHFWHNIDPLAKDRQFCDAGTQYRSGLYYHSDAQKKVAEASLTKVKATLKGTVVTPVLAATRFYPAETYHQDFYKKQPAHYQRYRLGCGRDARLKQLWGASAGH